MRRQAVMELLDMLRENDVDGAILEWVEMHTECICDSQTAHCDNEPCLKYRGEVR